LAAFSLNLIAVAFGIMMAMEGRTGEPWLLIYGVIISISGMIGIRIACRPETDRKCGQPE
jgi:hypothetical protein